MAINLRGVWSRVKFELEPSPDRLSSAPKDLELGVGGGVLTFGRPASRSQEQLGKNGPGAVQRDDGPRRRREVLHSRP